MITEKPAPSDVQKLIVDWVRARKAFAKLLILVADAKTNTGREDFARAALETEKTRLKLAAEILRHPASARLNSGAQQTIASDIIHAPRVVEQQAILSATAELVEKFGTHRACDEIPFSQQLTALGQRGKNMLSLYAGQPVLDKFRFAPTL